MNDKEICNLLKRITTNKKIRFHISFTPLKNLNYIEQDFLSGENYIGKPNGLWYSLDIGWISFLLRNKNIKTDWLCCYIYEIVLDDKEIKKLDSKNKVITFNSKFSQFWIIPSEILYAEGNELLSIFDIFKLMKKQKLSINADNYVKILLQEKQVVKTKKQLEILIKKYNLTRDIKFNQRIRWDILANKFDGVEFYPYFANISNIAWYSILEFPSGVIWNPKSILEVKLIAKKNKTKWTLTEYGKKYI